VTACHERADPDDECRRGRVRDARSGRLVPPSTVAVSDGERVEGDQDDGGEEQPRRRSDPDPPAKEFPDQGNEQYDSTRQEQSGGDPV
jgi:hypothetical protein